MKAVTYKEAKKNLKALIHQVCEDAEPVMIVGAGSDEQAVLISVADFQAMEETSLATQHTGQPRASGTFLAASGGG